MTDIPTATLNAWRKTLVLGYGGQIKPRVACMEVIEGIDAVLAVPPVVVPPVIEPPPVQPPSTTFVDHAPIKDQSVNLANVKINAPTGDCIMSNNGVQVTIKLVHAILTSNGGYGIYAAPSTLTQLSDVSIATPYYAIRGQHTRYESDHCRIQGGHSWRVYNCTGGFSVDDEYTVGQLRCGGGAANEWDNPQQFANFRFERCRIRAQQQVTIYNATHDVDFIDCDFSGTGKIFIDLGAKNIRFTRCVNLPVIDTKGQTAAQLQQRGIAFI